MQEVFVEKTVLNDLDHPTIVKFHGSFSDNKKLYFLLEHCPGKSLHEFLLTHRRLSLPLARHFTAEIVLALEYLRSKEVIHRDLKPGNIVLDQNYHVKLIDFATCKLLNEQMLESA